MVFKIWQCLPGGKKITYAEFVQTSANEKGREKLCKGIVGKIADYCKECLLVP